jgi:hypothetical protein
LYFSVAASGGVIFAASAASSPNVALLFPDWTSPFTTRTVEGSTFHLAAAACRSISRAEAPAARSWSQDEKIAVEPPVPIMPPKAGLPYLALLAGECSKRICDQSASISSATIVVRPVETPWPNSMWRR